MSPTPAKTVGRAKLGLGLSILAAVVAFVYLGLTGRPVAGVGLGLLLLLAGGWEYHRKVQDARAAAHMEADAEEQQRKRRQ